MKDAEQINKLGGVARVAELCGLHISAVSKWKVRGIPEGWKRYLATLPSRDAKRERAA
jgi:hypothetical protein